MHDARGVGLAATQVGVLQRLFVFQLADDDEVDGDRQPGDHQAVPTTEVADEGCLSLQGVLVPVERAVRGDDRGPGRHGSRFRLELEEMDARVVQHELDHLDGVLMLERTDDESRTRGARDAAPSTLSVEPSSHEDRRRRHGALRRRRARAAGRASRRRGAADPARPACRPGTEGRRAAAKVVAERLGIPVLQPERPTAELELPARRGRRRRLRPADPGGLLERGLWLNVHPSLLPRWRGAAPVERALLAGDAETGVTIHETVKELDAGPIAAQRCVPADGRRTMRGRCTRAPPSSRSSCSTRCCPSPCSRRSRASRPTRPRSRRRTASSTSRGRRRA